MTLTVLSVAYPLAPVGPDEAGGSEQVLYALDGALVAAGHHSVVVAAEGSSISGTLVTVPKRDGPLSNAVREASWPAHREAIARALETWPIDLIHLHGLDFWAYLPPAGPPALVTLHLPPSWYPDDTLRPARPDTWLHCVSHAQHRICPFGPRLLDPIENGVPVAALQAHRPRKRRFALLLGRVCPEKGLHLAIDAAKRAAMPIIVAGALFPYEDHVRYFHAEIEPRLDAHCRFIGPVGFARKRRLLAAAQCLLIPSLVDETSSLVAREAAACGTPAIAFARGALPETIEDGRTGFLVDDVDGMAEAMLRAQTIDPETCRAVARRRFSVETMVGRYFETYEMLTRSGQEPTLLSASG